MLQDARLAFPNYNDMPAQRFFKKMPGQFTLWESAMIQKASQVIMESCPFCNFMFIRTHIVYDRLEVFFSSSHTHSLSQLIVHVFLVLTLDASAVQ
jgi:hypothetical protein